jgi:hypothetical protein
MENKAGIDENIDSFPNGLYREVCMSVWGNIPTDKNWAIGSGIFKDFMIKHCITAESKPSAVEVLLPLIGKVIKDISGLNK